MSTMLFRKDFSARFLLIGRRGREPTGADEVCCITTGLPGRGAYRPSGNTTETSMGEPADPIAVVTCSSCNEIENGEPSEPLSVPATETRLYPPSDRPIARLIGIAGAQSSRASPTSARSSL